MKNNEMLVSIIIPVYKVEKYLEKCIESVRSQTYKNFELILVDDGSPDSCPQICDMYAKIDKRIRVIHKQNSGVSEARNDGVREATGEFICFIDSDDYISSNYLSVLINCQIKTGADVVFGKYCIVKKDKKIFFNENLSDLIHNNNVGRFFCDKQSVMGSVWRCLLRKSIFSMIHFEKKLKYCEDLYFILNLFFMNLKIEYVDEIVYFYTYNPNSVTRKANKKMAYYCEFTMNKCGELLRSRGFFDLANSIYFSIYLMAVKQAVVTNDYAILVDFEKYNTKDNYMAYKKYNKTIKQRIKAYLCRYKMFWILKILYK